MNTDMDISIQWISLSIFYTKSYWKQFMAEFLRPTLLAQRENGTIKSMYISFREDQGEHIQLALEFVTPDYMDVIATLKDRLTDYLESSPSTDNDAEYKGAQFFMNFPNNTIQKELFNPLFIKKVSEFELLLSERILNVFAEEDMDDSTTLSFMLAVVMIFCSSWESIYPGTLIKKLSAIDYNKNDHLFDKYHNLFLENKKLIIEMYNESAEPADLLPLKEWYTRFLRNEVAVDISKNTFCLPVDKTVVWQLNRDSDLLPYIYYLVYLILTEKKEEISLK